MDCELKKGSLEMLLLALVRESERYGYELASALEEGSDGKLSVSAGTLYPVLYRLNEDGFLETRWEPEGTGPPRKYYRITEAGETELVRRVEEWRHYAAAVSSILERADISENQMSEESGE